MFIDLLGLQLLQNWSVFVKDSSDFCPALGDVVKIGKEELNLGMVLHDLELGCPVFARSHSSSESRKAIRSAEHFSNARLRA